MSVSLKIKGNKLASAGVGADLIAIGDPRFVIIDSTYNTADIMSDFVVIRHYADKSVYTMVSKNVTPFESTREGSLYIAISLPRGEHIPGLYSLLYELSQAYKTNYMTYDGRYYHFTNIAEDPDLFAAILQRYPTVRYPYRPVVSVDNPNSVAYMFMSPEDIGNILADPMRGEFSQFGQVVLIPVSNPDAYASTIKIPSRIKRAYKVVVNGRPNQQPVTDPTAPIAVSIAETATHEGASLQFSIDNARAGKVPGVEVDDYNQTVNVRLNPIKKPTLPPPPKRSTPAWVHYIIGGVVALIIGGGVEYFLGVFDKPELSDSLITPCNDELSPDIIEQLNAQQTQDNPDEIIDTEGSIEDNENTNPGKAAPTPPDNQQTQSAEPPTRASLTGDLKTKYDQYLQELDNPSTLSNNKLNEITAFNEQHLDGKYQQESRKLNNLVSLVRKASTALHSFKDNDIEAYKNEIDVAIRNLGTNLPNIKNFLQSKVTSSDLVSIGLRYNRKPNILF